MNRLQLTPGTPRKHHLAAGLALFLAVFSPLEASAQAPRDSLLVDADWLAARLTHGGIVVLHVASGPDDASAPAIPGSSVIYLDQISINRQVDGEPLIRLDLPLDLSSVRQVFEAAGISDDSRVVVTYGDGRFPDATRAIWTLQVLGKDTGVSVLNGGLEAWTAAGGQLSTERATPSPGRLEAPLRLDRRVDADFVLENGRSDGIALIDARRPVSYDGSRPELPGRTGHIPGAGSLPQSELYTDAGMLKGSDALEALFTRAGLNPGDGVVAYCHIGYWASAVVFAARTLGLDARLYDGSMTEWAANPALPLILP